MKSAVGTGRRRVAAAQRVIDEISRSRNSLRCVGGFGGWRGALMPPVAREMRIWRRLPVGDARGGGHQRVASRARARREMHRARGSRPRHVRSVQRLGSAPSPAGECSVILCNHMSSAFPECLFSRSAGPFDAPFDKIRTRCLLLPAMPGPPARPFKGREKWTEDGLAQVPSSLKRHGLHAPMDIALLPRTRGEWFGALKARKTAEARTVKTNGVTAASLPVAKGPGRPSRRNNELPS